MWRLVLKLAVEGLGTQESFNEDTLNLKSDLEPHLKQLQAQEGLQRIKKSTMGYPYQYNSVHDAGSEGESGADESGLETEDPRSTNSATQDQGATKNSHQSPMDPGTAAAFASKGGRVGNSSDATKRSSQRLADKAGQQGETAIKGDVTCGGSAGQQTWRSRWTKRTRGGKTGRTTGNASARERAAMRYSKTGSQGSAVEKDNEDEDDAEDEGGSESGGSKTDGERFEELSEGEDGFSRFAAITRKIHDLERTSPKRFGDIMNNTKLPMKRRVKLLARALVEPPRKRAKIEFNDYIGLDEVPEVNVRISFLTDDHSPEC